MATTDARAAKENKKKKQPATAQLGKTKAGLDIGYRLLDMSRQEVKPFTRQGVSMTGIPGTFAALVDAPAQGGFIVWGLADKDIAEAPIAPQAPEILSTILAAMPKTPVIQMDTSAFDNSVAQIHEYMHELEPMIMSSLQHAGSETIKQVSEINTTLAALRDDVDHLSLLNDAATQAELVRNVRDKLTEVLGDQAPIVRLVNDNSPSELTSILETVSKEVDRLSTTVNGVTADQAAREQIKRKAAALDDWLKKHGGK